MRFSFDRDRGGSFGNAAGAIAQRQTATFEAPLTREAILRKLDEDYRRELARQPVLPVKLGLH